MNMRSLLLLRFLPGVRVVTQRIRGNFQVIVIDGKLILKLTILFSNKISTHTFYINKTLDSDSAMSNIFIFQYLSLIYEILPFLISGRR